MDATPEETEHDHADTLQCAHCNTVLPSDALYCGLCGESLGASISEAPQTGDTPGTTGTASSIVQGGSMAEIPQMQGVGSEGETQLIGDPDEDTSPRLPCLQPSGEELHISDSCISPVLLRSWQVIVVLSAVAAAFVTFVFPQVPLHPIVVMWFLFICPGMMLVRFLHLNQPVVEWVLALALSLAIDAIVSGIVLYVGKWSPATILSIIIGLSIAGAVTQLAISNQKSA